MIVSPTLILGLGLVGGACIAGFVFLAWYLNMRFRNLRNAVLAYGEQMQQQERRYDALARQHTRVVDRLNAIQGTILDIATVAPDAQEEQVSEVVTAWSRILREDEHT